MQYTRKFECSIAWFLQIAMLPLLFLVPIYTDEVVYKLFQARMLIDGIFANTPFPQCHSPQDQLTVFFLFWPFRLMESLTFGLHFSPFWIRGTSSLHVLAATGLICFFLKSYYQKSFFFLVTALFFMGVTPLVLVFSRPEFSIFILLMLTAFLGARLYREPLPGNHGGSVALIMILYVWILSYHHKSLFFLPLFLLIYLFAPLKRTAKGVAMSLLLVISALAFFYTQELLTCLQSPATAELLRKEALSPVEFLQQPLQASKTLLHNLSRVWIYFRSLMFRPTYMSSWLPQVTFFHLFGDAFNKLAIFYFYIFSLIILLGVGRAIASLVRGVRRFDDVLLVGFLAFILALSGIQVAKNAYEATLLAPMFVVMLLISLQKIPYEKFRYLSFLRLGLVVLAFGTLATGYYGFRSPFQNWFSSENLDYQPNSFTTFYYYKHQEEAKKLYQECGLPPVEDITHLTIDDVTYGYFYGAKKPFHILYLVGKWGAATEDHLLEFLRERDSDGILTRCKELPEKYAESAKRLGDFCCLKL